MRASSTAAVAASSEQVGPDGVREPAGEAHAWHPGRNETVCGLALSRTRLRRFPHVRFDFTATDVVSAGDPVGWICPRCVAATTGQRRDAKHSWVRHAPRP